MSPRGFLRTIALGAAAASLLLTSACGSGSSSASGKTVVGFIMVGSDQDYGYNEAAFAASQKLGADMSDVKVITADNIPETDAVTQAMQTMADAGAKVIFATSYGYFSYAEKFAKSHPDVTVLHQGGYEKGTFPPNFGTYWGQAYEPVSLGGMAAGAMTKTNKLGFVYAFPIPQTIANIDAFELGALKVNPAARTLLVNTSNWCDPLKQKDAAASLLAQGADVLSQHQDCQTTVIQAAKAAGKYVVGYHFDADSLDPTGWLTGSEWNWAPVYEAITKTVIDGSFTGGEYNANWIGSFADSDNPLQLASFGSAVPADVQTKIKAAETALEKGGTSVFTGPLFCNDGSVLVPAGKTLTTDQVNSISCLVKGVEGTLPKS